MTTEDQKTGTQKRSGHQPVGESLSPDGPDPQEDDIHLFHLWQILVKRKYIIFSLTAMTTLGAVVYARLAPPVYKAEATFFRH